MEELLSRKKEEKEEIIVWTLEKGKLKTKKYSKVTIADEKSPQYNQQSELDQWNSEAEEMYSSKSGNLMSTSVNTGAMLNNTSEESIC